MNLKEAMTQRHTVRKYLDKQLPAEVVEALTAKIETLNRQHDLTMKLMIDNDQALGTFFKLMLSQGVKNYLILTGDESPTLDEKLGYAGAELMLYAQTLGLNSWWIGGTFNKGVAQHTNHQKVIGVIALGYGQTQGVPHPSKTPTQVSNYEGEAPSWFTNGVAGALLAPTAMNKQDFMIEGSGNKVKLTYGGNMSTSVNLGIVKYHFELAAGKENFEWE